MSLRLENPKSFLALLLFIGFVFSLIGLGFYTWTSNAGLAILGYLTMMVAVILFVLINRRRF